MRLRAKRPFARRVVLFLSGGVVQAQWVTVARAASKRIKQARAVFFLLCCAAAIGQESTSPLVRQMSRYPADTRSDGKP